MSDADRLAIALPYLITLLAFVATIFWANRRFVRTRRRPANWWAVVLLVAVALIGLGNPSVPAMIVVLILMVIASVFGPTVTFEPDD